MSQEGQIGQVLGEDRAPALFSDSTRMSVIIDTGSIVNGEKPDHYREHFLENHPNHLPEDVDPKYMGELLAAQRQERAMLINEINEATHDKFNWQEWVIPHNRVFDPTVDASAFLKKQGPDQLSPA